jgi:hypothetical protein
VRNDLREAPVAAPARDMGHSNRREPVINPALTHRPPRRTGACGGSNAGSPSNPNPATDGGDPIETQNGGKLYTHSDGGFIIQNKNGKQEVHDKNHQARTNDPRWKADKTPVPNGEGGRRSGIISAAE